MAKRTRLAILLPTLLLAPLAVCGGDERDDKPAEKPVEGTFVGKVSGTDAFVAVVASPVAPGQDGREVAI